MNKNRIRGVGIGTADSGTLFLALSMIFENSYWLLVTGIAFFLIGLYVFFMRGR